MTEERKGLRGVPRIFIEGDVSLAGSGLSYLLCLPSGVISKCCLCNIPESKPINHDKFLCTKFYPHVLIASFTFFLFAIVYFFIFKHVSIMGCNCINLVYVWFRKKNTRGREGKF